MKNVQPLINRLLKALQTRGIVYKIDTHQFLSRDQDRILTKMILYEEHPRRDGEVFYSKVELLKHLAERWKEVNDNGGGEQKEAGNADSGNE